MKPAQVLLVAAGTILLFFGCLMAYNTYMDRNYYRHVPGAPDTNIRVFPFFDLNINHSSEWKEMYRKGYHHGYHGYRQWRDNEPYNRGYDKGVRDRNYRHHYRCPY